MINFLFVRNSENKKTGPIPVVYVSANTCSDSCPLKDGGGCYGEHGPIRTQWNRVNKGLTVTDINQLYHHIRTLPIGTLWRYGVVGDLPGYGDLIDHAMLDTIVEANRGRRGFAFSHKSVAPLSVDTIYNIKTIERVNNSSSFTVNLSADDIHEADDLYDLDIGPVVTVLHTDTPEVPLRTPKGRLVTICPAERRDDVTCARCGICANVNRKNIIGFRAHGAKRNTINKRLKVVQ